MARQLSTTASWTWRRGSWASSASGAASSNPMKARMLKIEAATTPENPGKSGLLANWVPNTRSVLLPPALTIRVTDRTRNTRISKVPRTSPARVEVRMPR
jgi:hypothetical protein